MTCQSDTGVALGPNAGAKSFPHQCPSQRGVDGRFGAFLAYRNWQAILAWGKRDDSARPGKCGAGRRDGGGPPPRRPVGRASMAPGRG